MKPRSAKAKGKRLQNKVTKLLQEKYSEVLEEGDFNWLNLEIIDVNGVVNKKTE